MEKKSTIEEIRERFDREVDRFSNLDTGQVATIDAPLVLELVSQAAAAVNPQARGLLDIGCGAGNYTLKLLERIPGMDVTLVDLSAPMLERARQRVGQANAGRIETLQGDIRELPLPSEAFDVAVASASLHHLRTDDEWRQVFAKVYASLRPGGSFWITDLIEHDHPAIQELMWRRFGEYLTGVGGEQYRDEVYDYVLREDTPRSVMFQLDLLRAVGFSSLELLHKNSCFAAFGGIKGPRGI